MSDPITPSERAAIAAYTGEVRVIPRGVSSEPLYTYVEGSTAAGWLVSTGPTAKDRVSQAHRIRKRGQMFRALKAREQGR